MINAYDGPKTEPWFDEFGDLEAVRAEEGDALYKESMREMSDKIVDDYWTEYYPKQAKEFSDFNKAVGLKPTVAITEDVGFKFDGGKPRYDLEQVLATEEVMKVLTFGAKKYAPDSWRLVPEFERRYYAAARRHLAAYMRGELVDPESGLSHLAHAITGLSFLLEHELENKQSQE